MCSFLNLTSFGQSVSPSPGQTRAWRALFSRTTRRVVVSSTVHQERSKHKKFATELNTTKQSMQCSGSNPTNGRCLYNNSATSSGRSAGQTRVKESGVLFSPATQPYDRWPLCKHPTTSAAAAAGCLTLVCSDSHWVLIFSWPMTTWPLRRASVQTRVASSFREQPNFLVGCP